MYPKPFFNCQIRPEPLPRVSYILYNYLLFYLLFVSLKSSSTLSTIMRIKRLLNGPLFCAKCFKILLHIGGTKLDSLGFPKMRSSGTVPHATWSSLRFGWKFTFGTWSVAYILANVLTELYFTSFELKVIGCFTFNMILWSRFYGEIWSIVSV